MSNSLSKNAAPTVALITGGSAGIGQSVAMELARRGSGVILTYRTHREEADAMVAAIEQAGGQAVALPLDLGQSSTFAEFRQQVSQALRQRWQRDTLTYLVNNGGFGQMSAFADTSEELFDRFIAVNLKGPYFLTQHLLPLLEDGGAIVNTTSNSALPTGLESGYSAYAPSKGGLAVLTRCLAKELSPRGIRVNSIAPGATRTRIGDDAFAKHPEVIPVFAARTALGRVGEADDLGRAIASLLSDDWGWVTGENIEVSGGYRL